MILQSKFIHYKGIIFQLYLYSNIITDHHVKPDRSPDQVLRGVQRQHSQEAEDHRRVSHLHLLHWSRAVCLLLSRRNLPIQCIPLWLHLQRRIICSRSLSPAPGN